MEKKIISLAVLAIIFVGAIWIIFSIEYVDVRGPVIFLAVLAFIALILAIKDVVIYFKGTKKSGSKKNEEEKEKIIKNRFSEILKFGQGYYPAISLNLDDLLFIIENKTHSELKRVGVDRLLAWGLGNVNLKDVLVTWVSNEKNQIVFHPKSAEILRLYEEAYDKIYDDKALEALSGSIENLSRFLSEKTTVGAKGAKELRGLITKECKSFPFTSLNPRSIN